MFKKNLDLTQMFSFPKLRGKTRFYCIIITVTINPNRNSPQLALFILAWAALWSFVSGYIYTAGTAEDLTFTREYASDDSPFKDQSITMVIFKDHVSSMYQLPIK